jgi:predicted nucleic-acid-binding protein
MIAFDTNALVRFLIEDDKDQAKIVRDIITDTEDHSGRILILSEVLIETVWVLESVYNCTRYEISRFLETLVQTSIFVTSEPLAIRISVAQYKNGGDFADCVIVNKAKYHHARKMFSFDKKLQKQFPDYVVDSIQFYDF